MVSCSDSASPAGGPNLKAGFMRVRCGGRASGGFRPPGKLHVSLALPAPRAAGSASQDALPCRRCYSEADNTGAVGRCHAAVPTAARTNSPAAFRKLPACSTELP